MANQLEQLLAAAKKASLAASKKITVSKVDTFGYAIGSLRMYEAENRKALTNALKTKNPNTDVEGVKGLSKANIAKLEKLERDYAKVKERLLAKEKIDSKSLKDLINAPLNFLQDTIAETTFTASLSKADKAVWIMMCEVNPAIQSSKYPTDNRRKMIAAMDIIVNSAKGKNGKLLNSKKGLVKAVIRLSVDKDYRKHVLGVPVGKFMKGEDSEVLLSIVKSLLDPASGKEFYSTFS